MKRSDYIVALSRDHHFGLLFSWKIKQGLKLQADVNRISKYAGYFWTHHLKKHFEEEENLLFNKWPHEGCTRALKDHQAIEKKITAITTSKASEQAFIELAEMIDEHIRFEERELFPFLEQNIPVQELILIGAELDKLHKKPVEDNFEDAFWIK